MKNSRGALMKGKKIIIIGGNMVFSMLIIFSLRSMEEKKNMFLSNVDVDDELFFEHWRGFEKQALEILEQKEPVDGTIEVSRAGKLMAKFKIRKKRVVTQFPEGQLVLGYEAFKLRLESKDEEHNIGTLRGDKYMPMENGLRPGQNLLDDAPYNVYCNLADDVGNTKGMLQDSEDMTLLKKRKRRCCCILN